MTPVAPAGGLAPTSTELSNQVFNWARIVTSSDFLNDVAINPSGVNLTASVTWSCTATDLSTVDGSNWTLKAVADAHHDDFASCDQILELFNGVCNFSLANDDPINSNILTRPRPIVTDITP